jgi:hypothetical protein
MHLEGLQAKLRMVTETIPVVPTSFAAYRRKKGVLKTRHSVSGYEFKKELASLRSVSEIVSEQGQAERSVLLRTPVIQTPEYHRPSSISDERSSYSSADAMVESLEVEDTHVRNRVQSLSETSAKDEVVLDAEHAFARCGVDSGPFTPMTAVARALVEQIGIHDDLNPKSAEGLELKSLSSSADNSVATLDAKSPNEHTVFSRGDSSQETDDISDFGSAPKNQHRNSFYKIPKSTSKVDCTLCCKRSVNTASELGSRRIFDETRACQQGDYSRVYLYAVTLLWLRLLNDVGLSWSILASITSKHINLTSFKALSIAGELISLTYYSSIRAAKLTLAAAHTSKQLKMKRVRAIPSRSVLSLRGKQIASGHCK